MNDIKKETNIYEDALMDICKRQKLPEMYEKLLDVKFNRILINSKYIVYGIAKSDNELKFDLRKTENFPGEELVSQKLCVSEFSDDGSLDQHFMCGEIALTHHDDLSAWTGTIHLFDKDDSVNRVEKIADIAIV